MLRVDIQDDVDRIWWDDQIKKWESGNIYQTTIWSAFYQKYTDGKPWYLTAWDGQDVVGLLVVYESILWPGPFSDGGKLSFLRPFAKRFLTGLVWLQGPVMVPGNQQTAILSALLKGVDDLALSRNIMSIEKATIPPSDNNQDILDIFRKAEFASKKWATYIVDLTQSDKVLWDNLKGGGSTRTPIRKAQRQGVHIRLAKNQEDLRSYYHIMEEHARLNGLSRTPFERWALMADQLQDCMRVFLAEHDGRIIAGAIVVLYNGLMHLYRPVQSAFCYERRIYAGDLIQWSIIQWGHENGMRGYDLVGVNPEPCTPKEKGIAEFKAKWGGEYIEYHEYTKFYKPVVFKMIHSVQHTIAYILRMVGRQI